MVKPSISAIVKEAEKRLEKDESCISDDEDYQLIDLNGEEFKKPSIEANRKRL